MKRIFLVSTLIIGLIVLLYLIRIYRGNYFTVTKEAVHLNSVNSTILAQPNQHLNEKKSTLLINLTDEIQTDPLFPGDFEVLNLGLNELLQFKTRKKLKKYSEIYLFHKDLAIATNVWLILYQKGYANVIIVGESENEKPTYKFQPDISARLN